MPQLSNSVIRQLQVVFSLSTLLLLISLVASFYSIQKLISNSQLVNHTNEVLIEAENIISSMKDAETGQRGYLLTLDQAFLQPYTDSYGKVTKSYEQVRALTADSPGQQKNLEEVKYLYERKFTLMRRGISLFQQSRTRQDSVQRYNAMAVGKQAMDSLRVVIDRVQRSESSLLQTRLQQQQLYVTYTPFLLVVAAVISIMITAFTYRRIKTDMDNRLVQQRAAEREYAETARRINVMEGITRQIADGDYAVRSADDQDDELGRIAKALNSMAASLEQTFTDLKNRNWLQTGVVKLNDAIRGEKRLTNLGTRLIDAIAGYLNAPLGTLYLMDTDGTFRLSGSYAADQAPQTVTAGEGLAGQAISSKKSLTISDLPANYSRIHSSLGESRPTSVTVVPLVYDDTCVGVVEVGLLREPTSLEVQFLEQNGEAMAMGVNAALDFVRLQNFLEETQVQSEELQAQHSELENLNAELEMQAQKLQASEEELRVQQEELQQTNTELEERGLLLEERNGEIQKKADELELATRYKSEFLANMSHELRTPLNSILLLSRLLAENNETNLSDDQVEYAKVIQASGNGLLGLIDEILD
ncbi:MAG: HAMP domain-containing protein, partial [Cytophagaceae bacterium]